MAETQSQSQQEPVDGGEPRATKTLQRKSGTSDVAGAGNQRRTASVKDVLDALRADPLYTTAHDIVMWNDPVRSGLVFSIIVLVWFLVSVAQYSTTTLAAYLYLGLFLTSLALVQYANFSGKPHLLRARLGEVSDVVTRDELVAHAETTYRVIDATTLIARDALFFTDVAFSLKALGVAIGLAVLGNLVTLPTLLFVEAIILFTVPRIYKEKGAQIDDALNKGLALANEKLGPVLSKVPIDKLKLKQD